MASAEELILLERVFLKIGSADTDEQFEKTIGKFLAPILLKLSSPVDGVRKKVMELLVHVNKRLKSRPQIQLPMDDLFQQYLDPNISAFVTNFTVLYLKMGFPRLEPSKQAEYMPLLLKCLEGRPDAQQNSFLQLLMLVLPHVKLPSKPEEKLKLYGLTDQPQIREKLLEHMLDFLLLPYNYGVYQERARNSSQASNAGDTSEATFNGPPPGLSETAFKKVLGESPPTPETIEKIKRGIVDFISTDIYPKHEVLVHLLVATADTRYSVATAADHQLKCTAESENWNIPSVVKKLYDIFQGTVAVKGKPSNMRPELKRTPASVQLRLKIFPYLLKSREATSHFPASVQVVFDCLYGANTNSKLKIMAVQFIHQLCLHCADSTFRPMGAVLLSGMIKLIAEAKEDSKLRMLAYVAVGKIARRVPHLVTRDMSLLQNFFDAITKETGDNRLALQEALSLMSDAFKGIDQASAKLVEALIMQNVDKPESQARQMAVAYARTVFAPDHVPSRYVLLLACGDQKDEIAAEASKALRAALQDDEEGSQLLKTKSSDTNKPRPLPPFEKMVNYIQDMAVVRVKTQHKYVTGNNVLPFKPGAYVQILIYLRMCLAYDAGADPAVENVTDMKLQAPTVGKFVKQLVSNAQDVEKTVIGTYIGLIQQLLNAVGGAVPMYCMMEMVAVLRETIASSFVKRLDWIKNLMFSAREDVRIPAAELYALIVSSALSDEKTTEVINEMTENISKQALEGQHGSMLCLGYLIGCIIASEKQKDPRIEDMETDECEKNSNQKEAIIKAVKAIVELLDSNQMPLCYGACVSLGEIGRNGPLPLPAVSDDDDKSLSKLTVVNKLLALVKSSKQHNKVREQAALCVGYLCVGEEDFPHRQVVMEGLLDSAGAKQFELHFDIGDALVCCVLGIKSPEARDKWRVAEADFMTPVVCKEDMVPDLLQALLDKYTKSPNPHIRQAACIWLISLVKQCSSHLVIQGALLNIQQAFMALLSETDELTQDLASKGLAIVYEICGQEEKQQLVSLLVETLTTGPRKKQQVTSDTQVFEDGSLGKTPDGQSMTTYKELCSIANDLNQPDLIYKFMHLANHNAIWNTKKGAAFGFTAIAAQAGEQLAPYLHKIIPKLYRYQFDPNPKIQQAMSSIWNALVPKPKDTVDKYLPEILSDLQMNLVSNQWRIRESSCLAVNDILRGRNLDEVVDALPVLWENLFRVRDDIKESVRNAADVALKTLSRVSIKICDPNYGKVGDKATSLILPCLIKGLSSSVKEVQEISLSTLMKVSKSAGVLLKPHIPLLTTSLLESLSSLEPQFLNYASLHLASNQASLEKLDTARMAASKTSPMMETVNLCVQYVDGDVMTELVPRLTDLIKNNVGLATKAGCSNLIVSLCHQCPTALAPHAGKLLGALLNGLNDRNIAIRKSYAVVIGHLIKVAKDSSVEKLITRLKTWYLEKEEETLRHICGVTLHAMNRYNPDILARHAALVLPLCFLAMHQEKEKDNSDDASNKDCLWKEVWLDMTPGMESGIRLYLTELVSLSQLALQSQAWSMKAQAAATMADIADKLKENLGSEHLGLLLKALLDGLPGRTWTGKESLLKAIATVCLSCKDSLLSAAEGQPTVDEVIRALLKECNKENIKYKNVALICTTDILDAYNINKFKEISDIIYPMLEKKKNKDSDDAEDDSNTRLETEEMCYQCLAKAWPHDEQTQVSYQVSFTSLLFQVFGNSVWKVELSALKAIHIFIQRYVGFKSAENLQKNKEFIEGFMKTLLPSLGQHLVKAKHSTIRAVALDITEALFIHSATGMDLQHLLVTEFSQLVSILKQVASADSQADLAHRASECYKKLNTKADEQ